MYHYFESKEYLQRVRALSGEMMQSLCHVLKEKYRIGAEPHLVGSIKRNLVTQNADRPIDIDYNLKIVKFENMKDCRRIKGYVKDAFNQTLRAYGMSDCDYSTSCLTSKPISLSAKGGFQRLSCVQKFPFAPKQIPPKIVFLGESSLRMNEPCFHIDVCIIKIERGTCYRLIHNKTGRVSDDEYAWKIERSFTAVEERADIIKQRGKWSRVREQYRDIKNRYLSKNDTDHPSFVCYMEAVNNVYNEIMTEEEKRRKHTKRKQRY